MLRTDAILIALLPAAPLVGHAQVGRYFNYSGTISWQSRLSFSSSTLRGFTAESVTVTVVKDKATCSGTWVHNVKPAGSPAAVEHGTISGPGLLEIVVHPDHVTPRSGTYQITVDCPTPATATDPSPQNKFGGADVTIRGHELPAIPDLAVLAGTETVAHPETDSVNGATGTLKTTWYLTTTPASEAKAQEHKQSMAVRLVRGFRQPGCGARDGADLGFCRPQDLACKGLSCINLTFQP